MRPSRCVCVCVCVCVCLCSHVQNDVERLRQHLQHLQLSPYEIEIHYPQNNHYECLRDQLSFLPALGAKVNHGELTLHKWPMTADTLPALRHLPPWSAVLDMSTCTWPEDPLVYESLASCMPTTYTRWVLGRNVKPDTPLLTSICAGINERRQGLTSLPVTVVLYGTDGGGAKDRIGAHVIVQRS